MPKITTILRRKILSSPPPPHEGGTPNEVPHPKQSQYNERPQITALDQANKIVYLSRGKKSKFLRF